MSNVMYPQIEVMGVIAHFGNVAGDYAKYRDALPAILFDQLAERGIAFQGADVVDLGSGTGIFARDLALRGAREVIGVEPSEELIREAVRLDRSLGIRSIRYVNAHAENFELSRIYPIFTAVRAWHWFDRAKAIRNIRNHLEPGGYLIVINSVFLPDSEIAKVTFETVKSHRIEPKPAGSYAEAKERRNGFPVHWFTEWESYSLQLIDEWEQSYMLTFTHEQWCGKIRSVSWMTHADENIRKKVTDDLLDRLAKYEPVLRIPHQYSVVVLRKGTP